MDENIISNENLDDFILSLSTNIDNDVFELFDELTTDIYKDFNSNIYIYE